MITARRKPRVRTVAPASLAALLGLVLDEAAWMADALCAQTDPEAFFPPKGGDNRPAKRVCLDCSVRAACLAYAIDHDERGVWGGTSERERRHLMTARKAVAA